jgi:hypothetical protein
MILALTPTMILMIPTPTLIPTQPPTQTPTMILTLTIILTMALTATLRRQTNCKFFQSKIST